MGKRWDIMLILVIKKQKCCFIGIEWDISWGWSGISRVSRVFLQTYGERIGI
jgi:hypothetical protein